MDGNTIVASGLLAAFIQFVGWFWLKERLKQSIKSEYDKDLESFKTDLDFELEKKKKLYDGKLVQYKKYFRLLDSYTEESRTELFNDLNKNMLKVLEGEPDDTSLGFYQSIINLQADFDSKYLKFKYEINGLRLESGSALLCLIDEYLIILSKAQKKTVDFLNEIISVMVNNPGEIQNFIDNFMNQEILSDGNDLINLQNNIFKEMRRELDIV